jgi:hypothetical protein
MSVGRGVSCAGDTSGRALVDRGGWDDELCRLWLVVVAEVLMVEVLMVEVLMVEVLMVEVLMVEVLRAEVLVSVLVGPDVPSICASNASKRSFVDMGCRVDELFSLRLVAVEVVLVVVVIVRSAAR